MRAGAMPTTHSVINWDSGMMRTFRKIDLGFLTIVRAVFANYARITVYHGYSLNCRCTDAKIVLKLIQIYSA